MIKWEETYAELCKDKNYPCQYCKKRITDKRECSEDDCGKWRKWFKQTWRRMRKTAGINDKEDGYGNN